MTYSETVRAVACAQRRWSNAASRVKKAIARDRTWILVLILATAVLETAAAQVVALNDAWRVVGRVLAIAGALAIATAGVLESRAKASHATEKWTRLRSVSEALKEQMFRYLVRAGEYASENREALLQSKVRAVVMKWPDLLAEVAKDLVSEEPPPVTSIAEYVRHRVEDQINNFYVRRASELSTQRDRWRALQTGLMFCTAGFGAVVSIVPEGIGFGAWVAVLTSATGTVAAYIEGNRYDQRIVSYRSTADRLEELRSEWYDTLLKRPLTADELTGFVNRCEDAISVENQAWAASWTKQDAGDPLLKDPRFRREGPATGPSNQPAA